MPIIHRKPVSPLSTGKYHGGLPVAKKRTVQASKDTVVDVSGTLSVILEHLNEALCQEVFESVREKERQREWTLFLLARFWIAVVLKAPPALSHLLERMRTGDGTGLLPAVAASRSGFSQRCKKLPSTFFEVLYSEFLGRILKEAQPSFARKLVGLTKRFSQVLVVDGSRLDKIAHRLKILWKEKAVVLPGCLTALYDLFHGVAHQIWFDADAAASEHNRAALVFQTLGAGTLVLGDRLYCSLELFDILEEQKCVGVFRRTKSIKIKKVELLSKTVLEDGSVLKDWLVEAGTGQKARSLRMVSLKREGKVRTALTNALDPAVLSAVEVAQLYPRRWQIERLFFDLKEVLNLNRFYAANSNAVAMQVFSTAMVHAAFRVAQGRISQERKIPPERISPAKLFPRLALACLSLIEFEYSFLEICKANRHVTLRKPSPSAARNQRIDFSALLVEPRSPKRRRRKYSDERATWKSLRKVPGGRKLT
jgi:Transposase DDE domain